MVSKIQKRQGYNEVKLKCYLCIVERKETFPSEKSLIKKQEIAPGKETLKNFSVYLQHKQKKNSIYVQQKFDG